MPTGLALATAAVAGAVISSSGAKKASNVQADAATTSAQIQADAANRSADIQLGMFNTIRGDLTPYRDTGTAALPAYYKLLGIPAPQAGRPASFAPSAAAAPTGAPPAGASGMGVGGVNAYDPSAAPSFGPATPSGTPGVTSPFGNLITTPGAPDPRNGTPDWAAYLAANPDVATEYQNNLAAPGGKEWLESMGVTSPETFAARHYNLVGKEEGRAVTNFSGTGTAPPPIFQAPQAGTQYKTGDPDWAGYLTANPDVMKEYQANLAAPGGKEALAALGVTSPETFAARHYGIIGKNENRTLPTYTDEQIKTMYPAAPGSGTAAGPTNAFGAPAEDIQTTLENLPGYKFTRDQGIKAVTNSAAAKGLGGMSGAYGKGLARFVTGLADQTYGEQLSRIAGAVGIGQNASNQTGTFGQNAASGAGSSLVTGAQASGNGILGAANASAAGTIAGANAAAQGFNGAANAYLTSKVLGAYSPKPT